jgi:hypothetical protein
MVVLEEEYFPDFSGLPRLEVVQGGASEVMAVFVLDLAPTFLLEGGSGLQ